jgi:hypothetical protein
MRRSWVFAVCLLAAAAGLRAQDPDADRISVELLLGRGGWYVYDFLDKFSNVVSEETYIQDSSVPMQSAALMNRPGGAARNRTLKSDFLLVSVSSAQDWVPFRDVFEIDGQTIRDRDSRLAKLFLKPSENSLDQANRIQDESSRYNLGNMRRTINNPVLGIVILQPDFQPRFHYSLGKMDPKVGPGVWIVDYKEEGRPSFIRGRANLDLFAHGRLWIEAATGRLMKTEVLLDQPTLRARITASFRFDDRFGIAVPYEMQEEYKFDSGIRVTALATYDRFRRFDVSTEDSFKDEKAEKIKD